MSSRWIACAAALVAVVASVPAAATPKTDDAGSRSYDFQRVGETVTCGEGATCASQGTADRRSGHLSSNSTYRRGSADHGERESVFGFSETGSTSRVSRGTTKVTATFRWRVTSAGVSAQSTSGTVIASAGVGGYAGGCSDPCATQAQLTEVLRAASVDGAPVPYGSEYQKEVTLTVTATGQLPKSLSWHGYAYSFVSGDATGTCPEETCLGLPRRQAGDASATIGATLTDLEIVES
jgi:hypothetical protein